MKRLAWLLGTVMICAGIGLSGASASLLPVTSQRVAAGTVAVPSCDVDGVTVAYTNAFDTTAADYRTTAVTVSTIDEACAGLTLKITVRGTDGASLFEGSTTVLAGPATSVTVPVPSLRSSAIEGWAVVVAG